MPKHKRKTARKNTKRTPRSLRKYPGLAKAYKKRKLKCPKCGTAHVDHSRCK